MNSEIRHLETASLLERMFTRPIAVFVVAAAPAILLATIAALVKPDLSADSIGVAGAVPLVALYLIIRVSAAFMKRPAPSEIEARARLVATVPPVISHLVSIQVFALLTAAVGVTSAIIYAPLGLSWAWVWMLKMSGVSVGAAAVASLVCGFLCLARESHEAGGMVRTCHTVWQLAWASIETRVGQARGEFARHTELRPVH